MQMAPTENSNQKNMIRHHHSDSSQVSQFLHPVNGYRGNQEKHGQQPKNHMMENYKNMKDKENENKLKKALEGKPREEFKLAQFRDVGSKVKDVDYYPEKPVNEHFLKSGASHNRLQEQNNKNREKAETVKKEKTEIKLAADKKPPLPKKEDIGFVPNREAKNFIQRNATSDLKTIARKGEQKAQSANYRTRNDIGELEKTESFGKIPKYITERKQRWKEEEENQREIQKRMEECPPGMKLIDEEDRLETLAELERNRESINQTLRKFPIMCDTLSLQTKKANLEQKLQEVEEAVKIFSRKKVYIAE